MSTNQYGGVGQSYDSNYLWTNTLSRSARENIVRMSDGYGTYDSVTASYPYRCVCPVPVPTTFTGQNCFGPPGAPCFTLTGIEGGKLNMDAYDRAPASAETAVLECEQAHGHVANTDQLVAAIQAGAPNGASANGGTTGSNPWNTHSTGPWLHVADIVRYDLESRLLLDRQPRSDVVVALEMAERPDVLGGPRDVQPISLCWLQRRDRRADGSAGDGGYNVSALNWNTDGHDQAPSSYIAAVKDCITRGGHLPTTYEAAAIIYGGAPNGTGQVLYTSDETGYNGTDFLIDYLSFGNNANQALNFYDSADGNVSWIYKNSGRDTPRAHRCVYYPVDTKYTGPAAATCQGNSCFKVTLANYSHMWFDSFETPHDSFPNAFAACAAKGGRLASERDLAEGAIGSGLANGSGNAQWTTDMEFGSAGEGQPRRRPLLDRSRPQLQRPVLDLLELGWLRLRYKPVARVPLHVDGRAPLAAMPIGSQWRSHWSCRSPAAKTAPSKEVAFESCSSNSTSRP